MTGMKDYTFTMTVSALTVPDVVPVQTYAQERKAAKALAMENIEAHEGEQKYFDYAVALPERRCYRKIQRDIL